MEKQIGDILFKVVHSRSEKVELEQWRNTFFITVKNQNDEKFEREYHTYGKEKQENMTEKMFHDVLSEVVEACYVNSESYDSFEEWCWDFGYDENNESDKEIYQDSVDLGDNLLKVVSDEWLENMAVYYKLGEN